MSALSVALNTNSSSNTSSNANGPSSSQSTAPGAASSSSPHTSTTTTGPSPPSTTASIAITKSEFHQQPSTPTPPQSLSNHHHRSNSLHHARHSSLSSSPYGTPPLSTSSSYRSALAYDDYPMQHGPQPYPNARPIRSSSKPRRLSSSTTTGKSPTMAAVVGSASPSSSSPSATNGSGPLNTNSPVALAAAAAVTPDKLARLLLSQGPLAIRHITSHLAMSIPGFGDLSLSKQRRLIIAVLDAEDPANGVSFEKVGWGRWAAFKRGEAPQPIMSTPRDSTHQYAPHTKSKRRESITVDQIRPPRSPLLSAADHVSGSTRHQNGVWAVDDVDLADDDMMFHNSTGIKERMPSSSDVAVFDDDDEDYEDYDTDDDGLRRPRANSMVRRHRGSSSLIGSAVQNAAAMRQQHQSETDEEDWQTMGPASLRRDSTLSNHSSSSKPTLLEPHSPASYGFSNAPYSHTRGISIGSDKREQEAIDALVQLASI